MSVYRFSKKKFPDFSRTSIKKFRIFCEPPKLFGTIFKNPANEKKFHGLFFLTLPNPPKKDHCPKTNQYQTNNHPERSLVFCSHVVSPFGG